MSTSNPHFGTSSNEEHAAKILLQYHGFVFRQARRFVVLPDLAEDVAQQVFIEYLSTPDRWDREKDPRSVLIVITRRMAQKLWHERAKTFPENLRKLVQRFRDDFARRQDGDAREDRRIDALKNCMPKLPKQGRQLIEDYYFNGHSVDELAKRLQKNSKAVVQAMCRLREKLRNCVKQSGKTEVNGNG